jgi:pimeloyl-ACP methyl ester carboxylesterase
MPMIDAAGTQFSYDEYGAGEDFLLFTHGYLGSAAIWSQVALALADSYRCICVGARGIGRSVGPVDDYTIEQWAADVAAVAEAFGIDSYTCVGHSRRG